MRVLMPPILSLLHAASFAYRSLTQCLPCCTLTNLNLPLCVCKHKRVIIVGRTPREFCIRFRLRLHCLERVRHHILFLVIIITTIIIVIVAVAVVLPVR